MYHRPVGPAAVVKEDCGEVRSHDTQLRKHSHYGERSNQSPSGSTMTRFIADAPM